MSTVPDDPAARRELLVEVYERAAKCTLCALSETRNKVVFGAGDANADLMFVGEGPGAEEDKSGLPFVGRAGALLNELLVEIGLSREQVFIANTVKCRPPGNRDPLPVEIETCSPYLHSQVELIQPKVIATLGNFATKLLTASQTGITRVHGEPQEHTLGARRVTIFPLFHPAAALRTPALRETLREDFKRLQGLLEQAAPAQSEAPQEFRHAEDERDSQLDIFG
ncbi:type-4 uracil-DNA glycosylase [soil metagenome]